MHRPQDMQTILLPSFKTADQDNNSKHMLLTRQHRIPHLHLLFLVHHRSILPVDPADSTFLAEVVHNSHMAGVLDLEEATALEDLDSNPAEDHSIHLDLELEGSYMEWGREGRFVVHREDSTEE